MLEKTARYGVLSVESWFLCCDGGVSTSCCELLDPIKPHTRWVAQGWDHGDISWRLGTMFGLRVFARGEVAVCGNMKSRDLQLS